MRTLQLLFFTLRLLVISVIVYQGSRILSAPRRAALRNRTTLWAARKIAEFFLKRGGIYIKAAQFLSTVSNLLDSEFTEIFSSVQDRVVPRPYQQVRYRFLHEFGVEPEALFLEFDHAAIAAASLGQVHLARTSDGRKVAVKFLHPGIETQIRQDIRALRMAVGLVKWFYPYLDLLPHLYEFSTMTLTEIDYENEAENMRRIRDNFADDPRVVVPEVIDSLSGQTVLTTEFIEGITVSDVDAIEAAGISRREAAELMVETYVRMIFDDRFYHADPHPGNLFIIPPDGVRPLRIGLVDFGATQMIPERMFNVFERIFEILRRRDIPAFVDLALETGMLSPDADAEVYSNLAEIIYSRYGAFKIENFYKINPVRFGRMTKLRDLQAVGLRLRNLVAEVRLPRRYIYFGRAITLLLSMAIRLDEKVNVFMSAMPHLERYLRSKTKSPLWYIRGKNWQHALKNALSEKRLEFFRPLHHPREPERPAYEGLLREAMLGIMTMFLGFIALELNNTASPAAPYVGAVAAFTGAAFLLGVLRGK
jgi:ubiquinone biosynthesis protein